MVSRQTIITGDSLSFEKDYNFDVLYKNSILRLRNYISKWGGSTLSYHEGEMQYFLGYTDDLENSFPEWIFTRGVKKEYLVKLKNHVKESYTSSYDLKTRRELEKELIKYINKCSSKFQYKSIFDFFYVKMKRVYNLIGRNVTEDYPFGPFTKNSMVIKLYKICVVSIYFLMMLSSLFIVPLFYLVNKNILNIFFIYIYINSLWVIFAFSFIINSVESKYTFTMFVNGIISITPAMVLIINKLKDNKKKFLLI